LAAGGRPAEDRPGPVRVGVASGTWSDVNADDAKAAITSWTKSILDQRHLAVDVQFQMFESRKAARDALISGRVEAVSMLAADFLLLEPELQPDEVFLGAKKNVHTERYLLLARLDSGIEDVAGLAGKKLALPATGRACLAPLWVDTLLAGRSLGPAAGVLGTVTNVENPSKAVLQAYFRQVDACVVTSNAFELACELNPQLRKNLRVLAVSPEIIPVVFFFRKGYESTERRQLEPAIVALRDTAAGRQILTLFLCDGMVRLPVACLESTRELLKEHDRGAGRRDAAPNRLARPLSDPP
jgi:phosphonate transport system substrate-binding protein